MNYQRIYDDIIDRAVSRGKPDCYCERHHIVPRSMGGTDAASNLVWLTGREHYLVHWMLFKIHRSREAGFAWYRMTGKRKDCARYTSHTFIYAKRARAQSMSQLFTGRKLTQEHKEKLRSAKLGRTYADMGRSVESPLRGRELTDEHKAKVAAAVRGRTHTEETRRALSEAKLGARNPRFGRKYSDEERAAIAAATKAGIARLRALKEAA